MGTQAVIGIGTNLGDRMKNIGFALKALSLLPGTKVVKTSKIYESEPEGGVVQERFYNMNVIVETTSSPMVLLGGCFGIEAALGRERAIKNGPRILDLDLLLYEGFKSDLFEITVPHPKMTQRAFVLLPMADLFPEGRAPGMYFAPHLKELDTSGVKVVHESL